MNTNNDNLIIRELEFSINNKDFSNTFKNIQLQTND